MALVLQLTDSPLAVGGILTLRLLPGGGRRPARGARPPGAGTVGAPCWRWTSPAPAMVVRDPVRPRAVVDLPLGLPDRGGEHRVPPRARLVDPRPRRRRRRPRARQRTHPRHVVRQHPDRCRAVRGGRRAARCSSTGRPYALVFFIDAATFVVSFLCIARLTQLGPSTATEADGDEHTDLRFRDAFRIPLVAAVMPAALAVSLGLGALFSLGIVFVRDVLHASDAEFGVLIALFGVGAVVGLVVLQRLPAGDLLARTRVGVALHRRRRRACSASRPRCGSRCSARSPSAPAPRSRSPRAWARSSRRSTAASACSPSPRSTWCCASGSRSPRSAPASPGDLLADVHWPVVGTLRTVPRGTARRGHPGVRQRRASSAGPTVSDA